jgi:hypothetical protein
MPLLLGLIAPLASAAGPRPLEEPPSSLDKPGLASPGSGEIPAEPAAWTPTFTPYVWVPMEVDGTSTVGGASVDLDLSFSDLIDNFDVIGASGLIELEREDSPLSFFAAVSYLDLDSKDIARTTPLPGSPQLEVDIDIAQTQIDFGLKYEVAEWTHGDRGGAGTPRITLDVFVGGRYMSLKQEVSGGLGPTSFDVGGTEDWIDLSVGLGIEAELSDEWSMLVGGAGSGFGIGGSSDLTGNLVFGAGYRPRPNVQFRFEYQFYWIDFETTRSDGSFGIDVFMHGPWLGVSWTF